jgi:hypothetical protein
MNDNNTSTPFDGLDDSAMGRVAGDTSQQDERAKPNGGSGGAVVISLDPHRSPRRLRDMLDEVKADEAADPSLETRAAAAVAARAVFGSEEATAALAVHEASEAEAEAERLAGIDRIAEALRAAPGPDMRERVPPGSAGGRMPVRNKLAWTGEVVRRLPLTKEGQQHGDRLIDLVTKEALSGINNLTERKRIVEREAKKYDEETKATAATAPADDEEDVEYAPAADPMPLADIADEALDSFQRWLSASEDQLTVAVLWSIGCWGLLPGCTKRQLRVLGGVAFYPYLWISSVGENSGKSTMLTSLGSLVRAPYDINRITPAALFRDFAARQRVGLADEIGDTLCQYREIQQLLEVMCYRHGVVKLTEEVTRGGRKTRATVRFHVHGGLALCGVERRGGTMRSTVQSRSIHLHMTPAAARGAFKPLPLEVLHRQTADAADRWGPSLAAHADAIRVAMVEGPQSALPAFFHNRRRDVWVHLFAVAELLGGAWPARCLAACRAIEPSAKGGVVTDAQDLLDAMRAFHEERMANYLAVQTALAVGLNPPDGPLVSPLKGEHPHGTKGAWHDPDIPRDVLPVLHFRDWLTTNPGAVFAAATEGRNGGPLSPKKIDIILASTVKAKRRQDLPGKPTCYEISDLEKLWLAADAAKVPEEEFSDPVADS